MARGEVGWGRVARGVARLLALLLVVAVVAMAVTRTGRYLLRAAWEEGKILARRRPIPEVIADSGTPADVRDKLRLVLEARAFAADSIGLDVGESFTTYSRLDSDTLVVVLSAAPMDELRPYLWWFPVVGSVPYKGFFAVDDARAEAGRLEERGYDSYLRPASAFSTLGWFNDPLVSTTVRYDSLTLVNTVIHELLHNSFYAPGQAVFNESFANFVGARGAQWFYESRGDSVMARRAELRWHDELLLGEFWSGMYDALDSAFAAHPGTDSTARATRIAARDSVFAMMRAKLETDVAPRMRSYDPRAIARMPFGNAILLSRRIYLTGLDEFERVYEREGRDLRRTVGALGGRV